MNKSFAAVAAAAAISLASALASAQGEIVEITPEVEASFQEHITTTNVTPATVDTELAVGGTVPADVTLNSVPPEIVESASELEGHQFFVGDGRIYVVAPETREIVAVINVDEQ